MMADTAWKAVAVGLIAICAESGAMGQSATQVLAIRPPSSSAQAIRRSNEPVDASAVSAVMVSLRTTIGQQPGTANVDAFEAALAFAVDQSQQPVPVLIAAIDQLSAQNYPRAVRLALGNVRRSLLRRSGRTGTAAIASGGNATLGIGPAVSGGGSSDYTSPTG